MIGLVGHYIIKPEYFRFEIGYMILPEFYNNGYVTEAVKTMKDYGLMC